MAIDYGTKRVGIAVTDPMKIIASGLKTVPACQIFDFLAAYFSEENVSEIVVGYPKTLNNQPSESVKYIKPFVERLKKLYPEKKISLMDERFTSKIALRSMIEGKKNKGKTRSWLIRLVLH
jgi:putative Holliday junction resolvase